MAPRTSPARPTEWRNWRMMRLLERIAVRFQGAGVPLMALKGAALNLTVYRPQDARPMDDLDLLIRPEDVDRAFALLEALGGLRGEPLVREDFFPRFHYEIEYRLGAIYPVKVDLHVRPYRPLRYAQTVPEAAMWENAQRIALNEASILIPGREDMLIHLAAHAAIHGCGRASWLEDIRRWITAFGAQLDWDRFLGAVESWRLALPVRRALARTERAFGPLLPESVSHRLDDASVNLFDRLALWHAPLDAEHPIRHVLVNALSTPGWRFRLAYLGAVVLPSKAHMADWYVPRHWGWLPCAHVLRWLTPAISFLPRHWRWFHKIEPKPSPIHGVGVYATSNMRAGEVVARWHGRSVCRDGMYVIQYPSADGGTERSELTGAVKYLNHSCRANARLDGLNLVATRPVRAGEELTIDYGARACQCPRHDTQRIAS